MFSKHEWRLTVDDYYALGAAEAYKCVLTGAALTPEVYAKLMAMSLKRGILATTAIEGNTVTDREYDQIIVDRRDLPRSRQYQQKEIENVQAAFQVVLRADLKRPLDCDLIRHSHRLITARLPDMPVGQFRQREVCVGGYRPPDHRQIPRLMDEYCGWLRAFPFSFDSPFCRALPMVLAAHVFFELIHPFDDGNGRTGRLIELYLLRQIGVPPIAGHVLSNHYNETRPEYYKRLSEINRDAPDEGLVKFFSYAVQGLADGFRRESWLVQDEQQRVFWQRLIYDFFAESNGAMSSKDKTRRRRLALEFPLGTTEPVWLKLKEVPSRTGVLEYSDEGVLRQDLQYLVNSGLFQKRGTEYAADYSQVCPGCLSVASY